jgi:cold shock CspA family protein
MTENSTSGPQIARFIAKILSARPTPTGEVPAIVASLRTALENLGKARETTPAARPMRAVRALRQRAAAETRPAPAIRVPQRRTRRPIEAEAHQPEMPAAAPAAPRLMRRADVAPIEPSIPDLLQVPAETKRHGIVRWFDARTGRGIVRLPGFAEDVTIEAQMLQQAGLSRLYKGQEIEATVVGENGHSRVVSVALPGRGETTEGVFKVGMARRHAKPVVVEMKRDAMRRAAARVEAEQVLGTGRIRPFAAD